MHDESNIPLESLLHRPRLAGEALLAIADLQDERNDLRKQLSEEQPYVAIGRALATPFQSLSIRNALDVLRATIQTTHWISHAELCALLRRYGWVKMTDGDKTHRPTARAVADGVMERVYFRNCRSYKPFITPMGMELLKYALSTGKHNTLTITE